MYEGMRQRREEKRARHKPKRKAVRLPLYVHAIVLEVDWRNEAMLCRCGDAKHASHYATCSHSRTL